MKKILRKDIYIIPLSTPSVKRITYSLQIFYIINTIRCNILRMEIFGSLFPGERISKSMDYLSELEVFSGKCTSICGYGMEMPLASNAFLTLSSRR